MLRCHVLFVTRGSSDCPSPAWKMTRPRKTRTLTGLGPDASCRQEFEGTTFPLLPAHLLNLLLSYSLLLQKVERSRPFSLFSNCQTFLKLISLDMTQKFLTLAITPHFLSAFHFFSLTALFRCAMFPRH